ncbi:MAG TPA: glycosyltransferase family 2 protein [Vicinamibacterales bacterium]|nr:glycosyltransferase family 2 protein [Vicinamibacterales bacterium]
MALRIVALVAAYNEEDIIGQVVRALIDDGISVYFINHQSTDGTLAAVRAFRGKGVIGIESFPAARPAGRGGHKFTWEAILQRKEELALSIDADWFIHHDADEFRESPWPNETLAAGIARADAAGYNAIDFEVLNFWPTADDPRASDVRKRLQYYEPAGTWDRVQIKCWKKTRHPIALALSGGHSVEFVGRRVCPIRFLLRHYPIRSQAHGERKVFRERKTAFDQSERARGWHVQYDAFSEGTSFVRPRAALERFDPDAVRLRLLTRHREVERLEQTLGANQREADRLTDSIVELRRHLGVQDEEMAALRRRLESDSKSAAELGQHLRDQDAELARLRAERDPRTAEIDRLRAERVSHETAVADLQSHLQMQNAELERLRAERVSHETALADLQSHLQTQNVELERLRTERLSHETALADLQSHLQTQNAELERLRTERLSRETTLTDLQSHLQRQDAELDRLRSERTASMQRLTDLDGRLRAVTADAEQRRREHQVVLNSLATVKADLTTAQAEGARRLQAIETLTAERDRLTGEIGALGGERDRLLQDVDTARRQAESQAATAERLRRERDRLHREIESLRAQLLAQDVEADRVRRELSDVEGERARVSREVAARNTTIEYMLASRSWRMTAPLRAADRWMRGRASESTGRGLAVANLPIGGGLRLASDVTGFWGDGWAGQEIGFQFSASRPVAAIRLRGRVPYELAEGQDLQIEMDNGRSSHHVNPGAFELLLPAALEPGGAGRMRITAARSWRPSRHGESQDDRDLAWVVIAIEGR